MSTSSAPTLLPYLSGQSTRPDARLKWLLIFSLLWALTNALAMGTWSTGPLWGFEFHVEGNSWLADVWWIFYLKFEFLARVALVIVIPFVLAKKKIARPFLRAICWGLLVVEPLHTTCFEIEYIIRQFQPQPIPSGTFSFLGVPGLILSLPFDLLGLVELPLCLLLFVPKRGEATRQMPRWLPAAMTWAALATTAWMLTNILANPSLIDGFRAQWRSIEDVQWTTVWFASLSDAIDTIIAPVGILCLLIGALAALLAKMRTNRFLIIGAWCAIAPIVIVELINFFCAILNYCGFGTRFGVPGDAFAAVQWCIHFIASIFWECKLGALILIVVYRYRPSDASAAALN